MIQEPIKIHYTNFQTKQHDIITMLLKFRHLTQIQIQQLLNQKAHERIRTSLHNLTDAGYVLRNYEKKLDSKPAKYCLAKKSIGYLRDTGIDPYLLKRLYDEDTHSDIYKEHCIFIASVYLSLKEFADKNNTGLRFETKTDLYNIKYLILPHPDAYFYINYPDGDKKQYFLELFDNRVFIYKRVYQYLEYYRKNYWQFKTQTKFPDIIFICPDEATKKNISQFIQKKTPFDAPIFYLTTKEEVQNLGLCREVLEKVEI